VNDFVASHRNALSFATARTRRIVRAVAFTALAGAASAAAPCGMLLSSYLESQQGSVRPCLVDLQENGLCFGLRGTTLDAAIRTLDAHLQALGVERPWWSSTTVANATEIVGPSGERLEIVIAMDGPFATIGSCRIVPER